jgi:glycosyltransferase involved in cell wall biosynthesis
MKNEKAMLISNKFPYPCDDGKKTVLTGFVRYLVDRFGEDNVTYVVIGKKDTSAENMLRCRVVWIEPPGRMSQIKNTCASVLGVNGKSMQESMTYSKRIVPELYGLIEEIKPDLVLLDTVRIGQYFWHERPDSGHYVLYMDDLFYVRYQRMLDASSSNKNIKFDPAGTFAPFLPKLARSLLRLDWLQTILFRMEKTKIEKRELACTDVFSRCLLINPNEVDTLNKRIHPRQVYSVKPLLYNQSCKVSRKYTGSPDFLMFGSLQHPVYRASVKYFLEYCMEEAISRMPDLKITIVGGHADEQIRQLASQYDDHVVIPGFIQNLDDVFTSSSALLIPMAAAGGLKIKTITALYYGLPIISTDNGVNGIPLKDGRDFVRENIVEHFPEKMASVCDMELNHRLSRNALNIFTQNYSSDQVYKDYDRNFSF